MTRRRLAAIVLCLGLAGGVLLLSGCKDWRSEQELRETIGDHEIFDIVDGEKSEMRCRPGNAFDSAYCSQTVEVDWTLEDLKAAYWDYFADEGWTRICECGASPPTLLMIMASGGGRGSTISFMNAEDMSHMDLEPGTTFVLRVRVAERRD